MKRDCLLLSYIDRIVAYIQFWDVIVPLCMVIQKPLQGLEVSPSLYSYSKQGLLHSGIGLLGRHFPKSLGGYKGRVIHMWQWVTLLQ